MAGALSIIRARLSQAKKTTSFLPRLKPNSIRLDVRRSGGDQSLQVGVSEAICWGVKSQRVLPKSVRAFSHRIFFFSSAVKLRLSNAASVSASVN